MSKTSKPFWVKIMHDKIYNMFDGLIDLIEAEAKEIPDTETNSELGEKARFLATAKELRKLRDNIPNEKQYIIDLQSFMVTAYNRDHAIEQGAKALATGDESAQIDQAVLDLDGENL
jgi:hypothetical protein